MRRYGVAGCPLGHSLSAEYFRRKFASEGIDADYALYPVDDVSKVLRLGLDGFNVTIPYKKSIMPLLDGVSDEAAAIGAVNCVKRRGGGYFGFNTDAEGIARSLDSLRRDYTRALILGSGGASAAVQYVLRQRGIPFRVVSRHASKGDLTYDALTEHAVSECDLIVNTTPVGMYPDTDSCPQIPYDALTPRHTLFDVVYNPAVTRYMAEGAARGAAVLGGMTMFEAQAEASWRIWNGDSAQQ